MNPPSSQPPQPPDDRLAEGERPEADARLEALLDAALSPRALDRGLPPGLNDRILAATLPELARLQTRRGVLARITPQLRVLALAACVVVAVSAAMWVQNAGLPSTSPHAAGRAQVSPRAPVADPAPPAPEVVAAGRSTPPEPSAAPSTPAPRAVAHASEPGHAAVESSATQRIRRDLEPIAAGPASPIDYEITQLALRVDVAVDPRSWEPSQQASDRLVIDVASLIEAEQDDDPQLF